MDAHGRYASVSVHRTRIRPSTPADAVVLTGPLYAKRGFVHLSETEWTEGQREIIAFQATLGMDPASRTVMRRSLA